MIDRPVHVAIPCLIDSLRALVGPQPTRVVHDLVVAEEHLVHREGRLAGPPAVPDHRQVPVVELGPHRVARLGHADVGQDRVEEDVIAAGRRPRGPRRGPGRPGPTLAADRLGRQRFSRSRSGRYATRYARPGGARPGTTRAASPMAAFTRGARSSDASTRASHHPEPGVEPMAATTMPIQVKNAVMFSPNGCFPYSRDSST